MWRATVLRRCGDVLCEAAFLTAPLEQCADGRTPREARRREVTHLRREGASAYAASVIALARQRPLLATFARRVDLPPALARHVHDLLLQTLRAPSLQARLAGS